MSENGTPPKALPRFRRRRFLRKLREDAARRERQEREWGEADWTAPDLRRASIGQVTHA